MITEGWLSLEVEKQGPTGVGRVGGNDRLEDTLTLTLTPGPQK